MANSPDSNHGIVVSQNVMVPMRDGVRLATDIYRTADVNGNPLPGQFPVILGRTSYDKSNPVIWINPVANAFVPRGYVVLLQDLRGRGRSEVTGDYFHTANQKEGMDGYDTIEWAADREWSNGKVGMVGASHGGIVDIHLQQHRRPVGRIRLRLGRGRPPRHRAAHERVPRRADGLLVRRGQRHFRQGRPRVGWNDGCV